MRKLAFVLVAILAAARPGVGNCGPLLNEVMADPATDWNGDGAYDFKNDEWAEIVNAGAAPLDLTGYFLGDEAGDFVFGFSGVLAAGGVLVVHGSDSVAWESAHGESTTGLRLGNDGDTITLWRLVDSTPVLIDSYSYNTYEAEDDRSTGRTPDGGANWSIYDSLNPYAGATPPAGNGLAPTPGAPNAGGGGTPSVASSWGAIKELYVGP